MPVKLKGKKGMSEMTPEQKEYYQKEAESHADFLTEKVFKPAFVMAFIYGVKYGREDAVRELKANQKLDCDKAKLVEELNEELNRKRRM